MMDTTEKNAPRAESAAEGQAPREGKRPHGRNHHRRGRGRSHGNKTAAETAPATPVAASDSAPAPETAPTEAERQGQKRSRSGRGRSGGDRRPREERPEADRAAEGEQRPTEGGNSRSRHSTGRPQRTVRHSADSTLPDMDSLLINGDGNEAASAPSPAPVETTETDMDEIERILAHDIFASAKETLPEVIPEGKVVIVGVRFRAGGKTYFFDPGEAVYPSGKYAIVETAHGQEFGEICISNCLMDEAAVVLPLRPVIRLATPEDIAHNQENHDKEHNAFRIGVQKIKEHKLDMKLVEVQYTFDNSKLLFYFTSEKRVDFRELVKDLAGVFHVRIELRQIGIRDEARMIGGLGLCGRPLCCTTFLSDFGQVSMRMAKEQNLSLNSTKISGCCGRLMCCLRYEHEAYVSELKAMPSVGSHVLTPDGPGTVTEVYVLKNEVKVSLYGKTDVAPKKYSCDLIEPQVRDRRSDIPVPSETPADTEEEPETEA